MKGKYFDVHSLGAYVQCVRFNVDDFDIEIFLMYQENNYIFRMICPDDKYWNNIENDTIGTLGSCIIGPNQSTESTAEAKV